MITELLKNNGCCVKEMIVKKNNFLIYERVIYFNNKYFNDFIFPWNQKVYNYINNIISIPICVCGNELKFNSFKKGYRKYCSKKCAANSKEFKDNKEKTMISRYGVKNPSQSNIIKLKKEKTLMENYNVDNPFKSQIIRKRIIKTNNEHWGVDNVSQSSIIMEKKRISNQRNYNVDHVFQSDEIKEKIKKSISNRYGVDYYVQSKENKVCIKKSINENRIKFWANHLQINYDDIIINGIDITIKNLCEKHKEFKINRYNLYNRSIINQIENICTICNPISESSSIKENEVKDFIEKDLGIKTNKIKINNKEIDIFISSHKLGIEFDGLYWHSDAKKDNNYHLNKTEECELQGVKLLHIFEDEWLYKKTIIKSIIRSKLNLIDRKIYARKCEVREIYNNKLVQEFLEKNHLQGFVGSNFKFGLFHNDELVSLMTFGKKRLSMGNKKRIDDEYEMFRFCNKLNIRVIGGASKLLKSFIKKYKPKNIISFADRRYSNGNLYNELGFKYLGSTKPNYWYFKPSEMIRYFRFKYRKDVLVKEGYDASKTEHEIMLERGYLKIYDCGNMKFELNL